MDRYFGTYQIFQTTTKDQEALLMSADNLIGDLYDIQIELTDGIHRAWLVNRFDQRVGCFNSDFSRKLSLLSANGLTLKALLSLVLYTEDRSEDDKIAKASGNQTSSSVKHQNVSRETSGYWGEMAVICFQQTESGAFETFLQGISGKLQEGIRPRIDFDSIGFDRIIQSNGTWLPEQNASKLSTQKGTVIMKSHRTLSDKLIEQGRQGNKGCYAISWAFIAIIVVLVIVLIRSLL